jgi:DNA-binding winged helix-turn-helix (wHTH) protein
MMEVQSTQDLSITFRKFEVTQILSALQAGDSCALVGIGSVGKSNLMRFLQRPDVGQAYLGEAWTDFLLVYIDLNKLLKVSLWGLFELMLHQLLVELPQRGVDAATLQTIDDLHQRATQPKTKFLALRYLDRAINLVCHKLQLRLVFLIDEFDGLCRALPPRGFAALRALRDDYKYRLMYVVATRLELKRLRPDVAQMEAFEELISSHTVWLGPYSAEDARFTLQRLEARHNQPLPEAAAADVLQVSGGHPGLLREVYHLARQSQVDLAQAAAHHAPLTDECQRIWLSLNQDEQQALAHWVGGGPLLPPYLAGLEQLRRKGLVTSGPAGEWQLFSPLLAEFVKRQRFVSPSQIHVDHEHHTIWINGYEVPGLTRLEFDLLAFLFQRHGQPCSRDELVQHLYPHDAWEEAGTDTRLDSVVKRLRKKIEPNSKEPRYLLTVHGYGFKLHDSIE